MPKYQANVVAALKSIIEPFAVGIIGTTSGEHDWPVGTILFHGGRDFDINKKGSFYSKDEDYAKKFASQRGDSGKVVKVKIIRKPKIMTMKDGSGWWWQDYEESNSILFKGYDAVLIQEPSLDNSLVVLNPSILEQI